MENNKVGRFLGHSVEKTCIYPKKFVEQSFYIRT